MSTPIEGRIRLASILVMVGLAVALGSFLWSSPLAFFLFSVGGGAVGVGILLFLVSLISAGEKRAGRGARKPS